MSRNHVCPLLEQHGSTFGKHTTSNCRPVLSDSCTLHLIMFAPPMSSAHSLRWDAVRKAFEPLEVLSPPTRSFSGVRLHVRAERDGVVGWTTLRQQGQEDRSLVPAGQPT